MIGPKVVFHPELQSLKIKKFNFVKLNFSKIQFNFWLVVVTCSDFKVFWCRIFLCKKKIWFIHRNERIWPFENRFFSRQINKFPNAKKLIIFLTAKKASNIGEVSNSIIWIKIFIISFYRNDNEHSNKIVYCISILQVS